MRLPMTFDILIALLILNSAQALTIQLTRRQTSDLSPAFKRAFIDAPDQPPLPRTAGPHEVTPPSPQADEPVVRRYYPFLPPADPAFGPPAGGMSRVYGRQAQRQGQKHHRRQQGTSPTTVGNSLDAMATTTATSTPSSFESGSASSSTTPSASPTSSPPGTASASLSSPSVPLSSPTSSTGSTPGSSSLPATLPTSQMTDQASSPQLTLPSPLPSPNNAPPPMPSTSTVPLNNLAAQGITYTVEVKVGNTTVPVVVDTGSSQFWVAATGCSTCESSRMKVAAVEAAQGCDVKTQEYGMGKVQGCLVDTDLQIADFVLPNQTIMAASSVDSTFQSEAGFMSGIMGLGMASGDMISSPPPLQQLFQRGLIDAPTVGFYLSREQSASKSEITFGNVTKSPNIDLSRHVKLPHTGDDTGHYSVRLDSIKIGSVTLGNGGIAAIDTGSTNLWIPEEQLLPLFGSLHEGQYYQKGGGYLISCQKSDMTAKLSLTFGGMDWEIAYEDLLGPPVVESPDMCYARIDALPANSDFQYVIGDVFLHNVYSAFNIEDGSVEFYGLSGST